MANFKVNIKFGHEGKGGWVGPVISLNVSPMILVDDFFEAVKAQLRPRYPNIGSSLINHGAFGLKIGPNHELSLLVHLGSSYPLHSCSFEATVGTAGLIPGKEYVIRDGPDDV